MRLILLVLLVSLAMVGCQAKPKTAAAPAPELIEQLTDQTTVHSCPRCGMDFDGAGQCSMCNVALVETEVQYFCPVDARPVERAGRCPRCDANARVVRTAMAPKSPAAAEGN